MTKENILRPLIKNHKNVNSIMNTNNYISYDDALKAMEEYASLNKSSIIDGIMWRCIKDVRIKESGVLAFTKGNKYPQSEDDPLKLINNQAEDHVVYGDFKTEHFANAT